MTDKELVQNLRNMATNAHLAGEDKVHQVLSLAAVRIDEIGRPNIEELLHPSAGETALLRHHLASLDLITEILHRPNGETK